MTCGIYILKFKGTNKVYIGQSVNIDKRKSTHYSQFKTGTHSKKLQDAYNLYGLPSLEIIIEGTSDTLDVLENEAIQIWDSVENGFNTLEFAENTPKGNIQGEQHYKSKYSNSRIIEAFLLIVKKEITLKEISERTNIKYDTIRAITKGTNHTWLKKEYPLEYDLMIATKGSRTTLGTGCSINSKYSRQQIEEAFLLLMEDTLSRKYIAKVTKLKDQTIHDIVKGKAYSWLSELHPEKYAVMLSTKRLYTQK